MALAAGARLGSYEILALLGSGGMGVTFLVEKGARPGTNKKEQAAKD